MSTVRYEPLSTLLHEFKEFEEELTEEFQNSDISWGSERQLTLANAEYLYRLIDEFLSERIETARGSDEHMKALQLEDKLNVLARLRKGRVEYYCMEE